VPQVYAFLNNLFLLMHVSILYGHNWLEILVDSNYGHIICTVLLDFFLKWLHCLLLQICWQCGHALVNCILCMVYRVCSI